LAFWSLPLKFGNDLLRGHVGRETVQSKTSNGTARGIYLRLRPSSSHSYGLEEVIVSYIKVD
jgi:hypothetical protein